MKYRQLGDSGISVSEIAIGSWLTYGVDVAAGTARACIARALEEGINLIDTSNIYGRGAAETFLGTALKGRARDSYVLATKLFFPMTDTDRGLSRVQIMKQIDASLARLQTDYVDLYQCHRYDPDTTIGETMQALSAVEAVAPAVELIDSRYQAFKFSLTDVVAGYLLGAGVVLLTGPHLRHGRHGSTIQSARHAVGDFRK